MFSNLHSVSAYDSLDVRLYLFGYQMDWVPGIAKFAPALGPEIHTLDTVAHPGDVTTPGTLTYTVYGHGLYDSVLACAHAEVTCTIQSSTDTSASVLVAVTGSYPTPGAGV